jgi:hypothetical protein
MERFFYYKIYISEEDPLPLLVCASSRSETAAYFPWTGFFVAESALQQ